MTAWAGAGLLRPERPIAASFPQNSPRSPRSPSDPCASRTPTHAAPSTMERPAGQHPGTPVEHPQRRPREIWVLLPPRPLPRDVPAVAPPHVSRRGRVIVGGLTRLRCDPIATGSVTTSLRVPVRSYPTPRSGLARTALPSTSYRVKMPAPPAARLRTALARRPARLWGKNGKARESGSDLIEPRKASRGGAEGVGLRSCVRGRAGCSG